MSDTVWPTSRFTTNAKHHHLVIMSAVDSGLFYEAPGIGKVPNKEKAVESLSDKEGLDGEKEGPGERGGVKLLC